MVGLWACCVGCIRLLGWAGQLGAGRVPKVWVVRKPGKQQAQDGGILPPVRGCGCGVWVCRAPVSYGLPRPPGQTPFDLSPCTDAADQSPTPRVSEIFRFGLPGGHANRCLSDVILRLGLGWAWAGGLAAWLCFSSRIKSLRCCALLTFSLPSGRLSMLVVGGSIGARHTSWWINVIVPMAARLLSAGLVWIRSFEC